MNKQGSVSMSKASSIQGINASKAGSSKTLQDNKNAPQISIDLQQHEFYEGEVINGSAKIQFDKPAKEFGTRISIIYEESYILFNEKTEQAIVSKKHKRVMLDQKIESKEKPQLGLNVYQFGIQLPEHIKAATFYHQGKSVIAKCNYKLQVKTQEKSKMILQVKEEEEESDDEQCLKASVFIKVNYHHKYVTVRKQLYDEGVISKFFCFGGGVTSLSAEYQRDTFCVDTEYILGNNNENQNINGSSVMYKSNDFPANSQNMIEAKFTVNNRKNSFKVDEILVELIQVIALKDDDLFDKFKRKKVVKHVQEILYSQIQPGILPKDETIQPRQIRIDLGQVLKNILKTQKQENIWKDLAKEERKHSRGLQQTSEGDFIENFYILRIKTLVNQDELNSPYLDLQVYFCFHDVPDFDVDESQMDNIVDIQRHIAQDKIENQDQEDFQSQNVNSQNIDSQV